MPPLAIFDALGPYARLETAVTPFIAAALFRVIAGKSRVAGVLLSLTTVWLAANVLAAPYSFHMQSELETLRGWFR